MRSARRSKPYYASFIVTASGTFATRARGTPRNTSMADTAVVLIVYFVHQPVVKGFVYVYGAVYA